MPPEDPFWIDSTFVFNEERWATDPAVRDGIAYLQRKTRAEEEIRRIRIETKRVVDWAVSHGEKLVTLGDKLANESSSGESFLLICIMSLHLTKF
jgi:hypothetical protein